MPPALISVVVPTYNGAAYLAEALASVRAQDYRPVELIVVDDGSNDASPEIATSFRPAVRLLQAHQGVAVARNTGLAAATGELIAFLDQDDWWDADKLRRQATYLAEQPEVGFVLTRQRLFLSPGAGTPTWLEPSLLEADQPGTTPSTLVARRALFTRLGAFSPELATASDADWFARAAAAGVKSYELPATLTHRRVHAENHARLAHPKTATQAGPSA